MPTQPQADESAWQEALPYLIWRAQNAVHRHLQDAIDGLGVTVTQLGLAVRLHEVGRTSAAQLARQFHLTPQSVSTALGQLERAGWVRRLPHPAHKTVIWYELTPKGQTSIAIGRSRAAAVNAELDDALIGADRAALATGLTAIVAALDEDDPRPSLWPARTPSGPG